MPPELIFHEILPSAAALKKGSLMGIETVLMTAHIPRIRN